jgi:hypothetical protein
MGQPIPFESHEAAVLSPVSVRFGCQQLSSKGHLKIRTIDDFAASGINAATSVLEKLRHDHHDDLTMLCQAVAGGGAKPVLIKADFKGAYRTLPLLPKDATEFGQILVYDTDHSQWVVTRQHAAPFGAVASVFHWERLAGAVVTILRHIGLPILRYVDDLFMAVPEAMGPTARKILEQTVASLGWTLQPDKTEGPASKLTILGVDVSIEANAVHLRCEPAKARRWIQDIQTALDSDSLTNKQAMKMAGRLNFAAGCVFGRVGRGFLRPIYNRQYSTVPSTSLGTIRPCLEWWLTFLTTQDLHRVIKLNTDARPTLVLYTDATGGGALGYAAYVKGTCLSWAQATTPAAIAAQLLPRETQVNAHETIAALWAICAHSDVLATYQIHLYIDNTAAQHILRKGTAAVSDLCQLAGAFWLLAAARDADVHIFRVPSKSNPADAPSRGEAPAGANQPPTITDIMAIDQWMRLAATPDAGRPAQADPARHLLA